MKLLGSRLLAWDRRNTAMRLAAHYVIGRSVGLSVIGLRMRQINDGHIFNECSFVGQYIIQRGDEQRLSHLRRMMVAVAGGVGKLLWRDGTVCVEDCLWLSDELSEGDWHLAGVSPTDYPNKLVFAGYRVLDLLEGKLHKEWCDAARILMRRGRLWSKMTIW
jgi:hypothetical protein